MTNQEQMITKMREILQEDYLEMQVRSYTVQEDLTVDEGGCRISCVLEHVGKGERATVEGEGVGTIDAFFNAMKMRLAGDYPSLRSIEFSQFDIHGLLESDEVPEEPSKAEAVATVGIKNSEGREFVFEAKAASVSRAGMEATVRAVEYFVNSELTFVRLHDILNHYRSEGRSDLVQKYTTLMSEVVANTSYSEVVEQIREKM